MNTLIETERLLIQPLTLHDAAFIVELVNTPLWLAHIGNRNINNLDDARNYLISGPLKSYTEHGYGAWLVTHKETKQSLGMCGLFKRQYLEQPDVGFAFLPQYERQGYAYEAVRATLLYAQQQLDINNLFAIVKPDNARSIRLLEKNGFVWQQKIRPDGQPELELYNYHALKK